MIGSSVQASKELSSAEDEVLTALRNNEIREAMRALPEQFRAVVYYADVEGLSYRKIAEMTRTPVGTVSSRLARGRRHLHRLLDHGSQDAVRQLQAS